MPSKEMVALCDIMRKTMAQQGMAMFGGNINVPILRATIEQMQKNMPVVPGASIAQLELGGVECEVLAPESVEQDGIIIYIHGGGLICGNAVTSRGYASVLAAETKRAVYTLTYRLAPENAFPGAVDDCFSVYKALQEKFPKLPIVLLGESGGAYLSVTTALKAMGEGVSLPAAVVAYSPVTDISGMIDRSANKGKDFSLTQEGLDELRDMYCPGGDLKNPLVSTVYADYHNFPPTFLVWDTSETLAPDSEILAEAARNAGVEVEAKGYEGCFHAFPTAARGTPESAEALKNTVAFIDKHIKK
jgi:acetyl esterase/lipase